MNLGEILSGVALLQPLAPELAQVEIAGIEFDSRRAFAKSLFFAFPGSKADGRQFAATHERRPIGNTDWSKQAPKPA